MISPVWIAGALIAGFLVGWIIQQFRLSKKINAQQIEIIALQKDKESDRERMNWLEISDEKLRDTFKALSADLLKANSDQFMSQAREKLGEVLELQKRDWGLQKQEFRHLVEPLEKNLNELDNQVRQLEKRREGAYQMLMKQVEELGLSQRHLRDTTISLTQALKSTTVRGRWGEVQLKRIAEMAGMINFVDFEEQKSTAEGRPDMVVHLPNKGIIPVDSKAPMNAYLDAQQLKTEDERNQKLDEHAKALRGHMKSLAQKAYWSQFERSPEFVVMVVPYDSGLTAAFERDGNLLEEALQNKVLIVSPVSLLALLKVIAYGWLQLQLAENAEKIAAQGKELYARFSTFSNHLSDVGRRLNSTVQAYNKATGSLESRVMPSIHRLKEMGAGSGETNTAQPVDALAREISKASPNNDE